MWTCIEERNNEKFGRIIRKIVFGNIYATRTALLSSNPIPMAALEHLEIGEMVVFYEAQEIKEGRFICSSRQQGLDPQTIVGNILNNQQDLEHFCKQNSLLTDNLLIMAIQVYKYFVELESGIVGQLSDNTGLTDDQSNQYISRRKLKRNTMDSPNTTGGTTGSNPKISRRDESFPETSQIIEVIETTPEETPSSTVQFEVQSSTDDNVSNLPGTTNYTGTLPVEISVDQPGSSSVLSIDSDGGMINSSNLSNENDFKIEHVGHQNDNDDFHLDNSDLISAVESCNQFLHSLKNRSRAGTNKSVLTPIDRLEIISIWENQTPERPESRASIARRYGVTRECVRQLLKKKDHWKKLAGVDLDKPIPESLFSVDEIKKLQLTLPTKLRPEHKT